MFFCGTPDGMYISSFHNRPKWGFSFDISLWFCLLNNFVCFQGWFATAWQPSSWRKPSAPRGLFSSNCFFSSVSSPIIHASQNIVVGLPWNPEQLLCRWNQVARCCLVSQPILTQFSTFNFATCIIGVATFLNCPSDFALCSHHKKPTVCEPRN